MGKTKINHPSRLIEAEEAERFVVEEIGRTKGIGSDMLHSFEYNNTRFKLQIDGYSEKYKVACEVWARVGNPIGAQPSKVMKDVLKLIFFERELGTPLEKIIAFVDEGARRPFVEKGWMAECIRSFGIKCELIELPPKMMSRLVSGGKRASDAIRNPRRKLARRL